MYMIYFVKFGLKIYMIYEGSITSGVLKNINMALVNHVNSDKNHENWTRSVD